MWRIGDPMPDPFVRAPMPAVRNPGRVEPKTVVVDSTRPSPRMRAHVHQSAATQSIANATVTVVAFNTVDFDNVGLFTASRFTIPSTGKVTESWLIHGHAVFVKAAGGAVRELILRKNGTTNVARSVVEPNTLDSLDVLLLVNDPRPTDFYELVVNQDSGGPIDLTTTPENTYFEIIHLF